MLALKGRNISHYTLEHAYCVLLLKHKFWYTP